LEALLLIENRLAYLRSRRGNAVVLVRLFNFVTPNAQLPKIGDGREDCGVELIWFLEWSEMTDSLFLEVI
jgi:hypothetical protein